MTMHSLHANLPRVPALPTLARDADIGVVASYNQRLLYNIQKQLEIEPSANILQFIPQSYHDHWTPRHHHQPIKPSLSKMGELNHEMLSVFTYAFEDDPNCDMIPERSYKYYARERKRTAPSPVSTVKRSDIFDVQAEIKSSDEPARIVYPLSSDFKNLIEQHIEQDLRHIATDSENFLTSSFKKLVQSADIIAQMGSRGAILKVNNNIIAKIINPREDDDHAEYLSLLYLATNLPDFPSPKPHGFIQIGKLHILLMSYVPSTGLSEVWHSLSIEEKQGLKCQLGDCFAQLRQLQEPDGKPLGSLQRHIVKERRRLEVRCPRMLNTVREHQDWQWSFASGTDPVFVQFLRSFLEPHKLSSHVFSHGDLSPKNIMVRKDSKNRWVLGGIVDWEHSGFYPESFECQRVAIEDQPGDWPMWLPDRISPKEFPLEWFVDRYLGFIQLILSP